MCHNKGMKTKICTKCHEEKQISEFAFKSKKANLHHARCKPCVKENFDKYYLENKERVITRIKTSNKKCKDKLRKIVRDHLSKNPCVDCGESDIIVLEFDHVRGTKLHNISNMVQQGHGLNALLEEMAKCEVRCANCHRRQTYKRRNNTEDML